MACASTPAYLRIWSLEPRPKIDAWGQALVERSLSRRSSVTSMRVQDETIAKSTTVLFIERVMKEEVFIIEVLSICHLTMLMTAAAFHPFPIHA